MFSMVGRIWIRYGPHALGRGLRTTDLGDAMGPFVRTLKVKYKNNTEILVFVNK